MVRATLTEFGLHCRQLRTEAGHTMADQARALDMTPSQISAIEAGVSVVTEEYLGAFGYWLKIDPATLASLRNLATAHKPMKAFPGMDRRKTLEVVRRFANLSRLDHVAIRGIGAYLKAASNAQPRRLSR